MVKVKVKAKVKGKKAMEKARRAELEEAAMQRRRKAKSKVLAPGDIRASFEKKHARLKRRMQQGRLTKAPTRAKPFAFMSEERMQQEEERRPLACQRGERSSGSGEKGLHSSMYSVRRRCSRRHHSTACGTVHVGNKLRQGRSMHV